MLGEATPDLRPAGRYSMMAAMPRHRTTPALLSLSLALLLGGCAKTNDLVMRLYASEVPAHAVVGEQLLGGTLRLYTDRTGTLTLQEADTALRCMGTLRYTRSNGGTVQLQCSNGVQTTLDFVALTETSGHGLGSAASLAYGLAPQQARAWLRPPPGRQIEVSGEEGLRLQAVSR